MKETTDRTPDLKAAMRKSVRMRFYNGRMTTAEQFKKCLGHISRDPDSVIAFDLQVWLSPSGKANQ